jgi:hypothetical protein
VELRKQMERRLLFVPLVIRVHDEPPFEVLRMIPLSATMMQVDGSSAAAPRRIAVVPQTWSVQFAPLLVVFLTVPL